MKIAIDTQTVLGQKSGFGIYVKNLVENLQKIDPTSEYIPIAPEQEKDLFTLDRFVWDQLRFPMQAKRAKVDVLHQPCFSAPIFYRGKKIATAHDIISIKFPANLPWFRRLFYSNWMPFSYRYVDMIIADSECTKRDIVEYLKISPEKIRVIYLAVSKNFRPINDTEKIEKTKRKYKTGEKYFIHVGTIEPRKNLPLLVEAFAVAVKAGVKENLVIVGKKGWYYDELFNMVKELKLSSRIIFTGYAQDEDIPILLCGATALTFPSLYEGFGLPPLEAMACGTPVISSNTSSLPEVVGEAGILLSPHEIKNWTKVMLQVSTDGNLRKKLKQKSLEQAKKFSWEETARKTVEVYKEVYTKK